MNEQLLTTLGRLLYPLAAAALCLWLAYGIQRLYWAWSSGELTSGRFYSLALRAGLSALTVLSLLLYLASRRIGRNMLLLLSAGAWPTLALAQNLPRVTLPGGVGADGNIFATFTTFAVYGGRVLVLMLSFTGICGISWQIIAAFVQARDSGDWGRFGVVFIIGAVVLLFLVAMGQFAWTYLESLNAIAGDAT